MNKNIMPALIIVLIILQVISIARIGILQNDINNTSSQLNNLIFDQSNRISSIYTDIDSMLKRQSSIIDSYNYSLGTADIGKLTVPVTFNITPKEIKEKTNATLYVSGESAAMTRSGTTFTATLPAAIFGTFEAKVVLDDNGIQKTEKLDISDNLRERIFPTLIVRFEGKSGNTYSKKPGEKSGEYHREGTLGIDVKPAAENTIKEVRLVFEVDGNIVSEKPIDNKMGIRTDINEKYTLSAGQTLTMSVIATDSLGFYHKTIVDKLALDGNADPAAADNNIFMDIDIITDKDGNILYDPQKEVN